MIFFLAIKKLNIKLSITCAGLLIYRVSEFKYLDIIIDELLSWKKHINSHFHPGRMQVVSFDVVDHPPEIFRVSLFDRLDRNIFF